MNKPHHCTVTSSFNNTSTSSHVKTAWEPPAHKSPNPTNKAESRHLRINWNCFSINQLFLNRSITGNVFQRIVMSLHLFGCILGLLLLLVKLLNCSTQCPNLSYLNSHATAPRLTSHHALI